MYDQLGQPTDIRLFAFFPYGAAQFQNSIRVPGNSEFVNFIKKKVKFQKATRQSYDELSPRRRCIMPDVAQLNMYFSSLTNSECLYRCAT